MLLMRWMTLTKCKESSNSNDDDMQMATGWPPPSADIIIIIVIIIIIIQVEKPKCPNDSPLSNLFHKREDKVFPSLISSCMILIFVPITAPVSPIVWSFSPKAVCDPRRIWSFRLFCCFAPNLCCISSFVSILLFSVQLQNDKALQKHHKHLHLLKMIVTKRWLTF